MAHANHPKPVQSLMTNLLQNPKQIINLSSQKHSAPTQNNAKPVSLTRNLKLLWLWNQMTAIYGNLFTQKHGMQPSKIWADVLAKMTQSALEGGFKMLFDAEEGVKFAEYPPNALQFRDLCYRHHASLNLPKQEDVRRDIEQYEIHDQLPAHSHVIVHYIAAGLPDEFFESDSPHKKQAALNDVYKKARELALSGHEIPAVEVKSRKKFSAQTIARQNLNAMYAILGVRPKQESAAC